jgi:hypothetical protein
LYIVSLLLIIICAGSFPDWENAFVHIKTKLKTIANSLIVVLFLI